MDKVNIALDKKLNDLDIEHYHTLNLNSSSFMLCGASGSGKSAAGMHLINNIVEFTNSRIWVCDGKHDDYKFLGDVPNARYYGYLDMAVGVDKYYEMFSDRLTGVSENRTHEIIVLEEFSSVLKVLESDKETAKTAKKMMSQAYSIASTGRSYNCHLLIILQRPSADVLQGFRENLTSILALGRISPEVAKMCGFDEHDNFNNNESARSIGWFLNDKNRLYQVRIPFFTQNDFSQFQANIVKGVTR